MAKYYLLTWRYVEDNCYGSCPLVRVFCDCNSGREADLIKRKLEHIDILSAAAPHDIFLDAIREHRWLLDYTGLQDYTSQYLPNANICNEVNTCTI